LRGRDEQRVVVFGVAAAAPAQGAHRAAPGDLGVELGVDRLEGVAIARHLDLGFFVAEGHEWTRAAAAWTSSRLNQRPVPDPGHVDLTPSQSSGVSMFSGQNGQVWHWTG